MVKKAWAPEKKIKLVDTTAGLLLAAGMGRRFDHSGKEDKLLARYRDGNPVVTRSALNLASAVELRIAVIRPGAEDLRKHLELVGFKVVECPDAALGMGHSLACGVLQARKTFGMQRLVVALGDMPSVKLSTLRVLLEAGRNTDHIVAPIYQGRRGNPVIFHEKHFDKLSLLSGDQGASQFMKDEAVALVNVDDPGIHLDIDTPDDLTN